MIVHRDGGVQTMYRYGTRLGGYKQQVKKNSYARLGGFIYVYSTDDILHRTPQFPNFRISPYNILKTNILQI